MSDPQRTTVIWAPQSRAPLRAIDRETALQILYGVDRYLGSRLGDVKKLKSPRTGFRLRCGDYRVFLNLRTRTRLRYPAYATEEKRIVISWF